MASALYGTGIPPAKLAAVISVFGSIPKDAQNDFAQRLLALVGRFHLREIFKKQKSAKPHQQRKQLKDISTSATRILKLLGVDKPESIASSVSIASLHSVATTWLLTNLYKVGLTRRPGRATVGADDRLATLLILLSDLVDATEQSVREVSTLRGRGGNRRQEQTSKGQFQEAIIELYIDFRNRFPASGPKPAFDMSLKKFVRSALELSVSSYPIDFKGQKYEPRYMAAVDRNLPNPTRTTDASIRGAFNRVRARIN